MREPAGSLFIYLLFVPDDGTDETRKEMMDAYKFGKDIQDRTIIRDRETDL